MFIITLKYFGIFNNVPTVSWVAPIARDLFYMFFHVISVRIKVYAYNNRKSFVRSFMNVVSFINCTFHLLIFFLLEIFEYPKGVPNILQTSSCIWLKKTFNLGIPKAGFMLNNSSKHCSFTKIWLVLPRKLRMQQG